jgi:hypothetical protein
MKLIERVVPPDSKEPFKLIAASAIEGDKESPKTAAVVQLFDPKETPEKPLTDDDIAKMVNSLRSGLASVTMGRFKVTHNGAKHLCFVTVNEAPVRKRAPKKAAPAPKKDAAPKVK